MVITIVSPPSNPPQASASNSQNMSGNSDSSAGLNFLGLLLAQLTPAAPLAQDTFPTHGKNAKAVTDADLASGLATADNTANEASTLLAMIGIIPAQNPGNTTEKTVVEPALSGITGSDGKSSKQPIAAPLTSDAESGKASLLSAEMPAAGDKAAKFAVTPAQTSATPEALTVRSAPDNASTTAPVLHSYLTTANQNLASPGREAALPIPTPIRDPNWSGDFGQKIVWIATNDKQTAQLTLNPPQMGPIEVSISVDKGNASAHFVSANAEVRQAIESALPRLREMLANSGIELGQTNVGAESFRQPSGNDGGQGNTARPHPDSAILASNIGETLVVSKTISSQQGNGLVDIFA